MKSPPPALPGGTALGAREEVLERHVQEGAARLGEDIPLEAEPAVDMDAPAAAFRHPGRDLQRAVDQDRAPVADEDSRGHAREAVPGRQEPAGLVESSADEPAVHDSGPGLMTRAEGEGRFVAVDPLLRRPREVDAVRVLLPATPACGVMVRRDLYRRPPRSKWAL